MKSFASDNYSPVSPEIFEFLSKINVEHVRSYGNDEYTKQASEIIKNELGCNTAQINFVLTGTAANVLSLKQCLRSTESVLVPQTSHLNTNEGGSPEIVGGVKLIPVPVVNGKIILEEAERIILQELDNLPHAPRPKMLSVAQSTEYGTVYTIDELKSISKFCQKYNLLLHLDLCRVYNAAVALNLSLKEIISAANPDIASLGGTKNGLMFAEAVVIFNPDFHDSFTLLQKQGMQLYSKMRYLSAQFIPYFEQKIWFKNAQNANNMCTYLYNQIKDLPGVKVTTPVQTNHIFVTLPPEIIAPLQQVSPFYVWDLKTNEVRFVTSFDTTKEDVDGFVSKFKELVKN